MRGHEKGTKKYRSMPRSIDVEAEIRFADTKVMLTYVQVIQRGHHVSSSLLGGQKVPNYHSILWSVVRLDISFSFPYWIIKALQFALISLSTE